MTVTPAPSWANPMCLSLPRYASDATVAIFVAILLFVMPSQRPKFNFCSQTEEGKAPVLASHSSGLGPWQQRVSMRFSGPRREKTSPCSKGLARLQSLGRGCFPRLPWVLFSARPLLLLFKHLKSYLFYKRNRKGFPMMPSVFGGVSLSLPVCVNMHIDII